MVVSIHALSEVDDAARLFRQAERVLRPNAPFVFSYEHPFSLCLGPDGTVIRSLFDRGPVEIEGRLLFVRTHSEVFADLHRAGLRADTLLEPRTAQASVPSTVIWRARTEGS